MAKVTIFGDFKVNNVKHLNLSAELVYLLNTSDVKLVNFEAPIHSMAILSKKVVQTSANMWKLPNGWKNVVSMLSHWQTTTRWIMERLDWNPR